MPRSSLLWIVFALSAVACDWEPVARSVQPQRVLQGQYRIVQNLDDRTDRYVLVQRTEPDNTGFAIVDLHERTSCDLPKGTVGVRQVVRPPTGSDPAMVGPFKLALKVAVSGAAVPEEDEPSQLFVATHECGVVGPHGSLDSRVYVVTMDDDQRQVLLWGSGKRGSDKRALVYRDPWRNEQHIIAPVYSEFNQVARPSNDRGFIGEQALWLREEGKLTQRNLAGKLLLSMGTNVSAFDQATFDTVRVTFVEDEAMGEGEERRIYHKVYEAAGPDFQPFLIAEDACGPNYFSATLNMFQPCDRSQLIRFDLMTGTTQTFPEGVFWSFEDRGLLLEYAQELNPPAGKKPKELLFMTPAGGFRTLVSPTLRRLQIVDATHIAGRADDGSFGVWSAAEGFVKLFNKVHEIIPYVDVRSGGFVWLMLHEVNDGFGRLSVFEEDNYTPRTLAEDVPVNRYSVRGLQQVSEPVVVTIEHATPGANPVSGELTARLLSGELPSSVDTNVTSFETLLLPLPGLLYTTDDGARSGLWFAAL